LYLQLVSDTDELQRIAIGMRQACVAMCVRQINRRVTRIYDAALRPYGLGAAQLNILTALALAGSKGVRQRELARALDVEKSTLSRNLARMLENGWIDSEADPDVGARIRLSPEGRRRMTRALPGWRAAQSRAGAEVHSALAEAFTRASRASDPDRLA
jgi:DNA-binding MarR family transcriptional regulator